MTLNIILLIAFLVIAGAFVYTLLQPKLNTKQTIAIDQSITQTPQPITQTKDENDVASDWMTYSNRVHNISFKYPPEWTIDSKNDSEEINAELSLKKDKSVIHFSLNLNGIGGIGQDIDGISFTLDKLNLFQYEKDNTYGGIHTIGLTDTITNTLGVFKHNGKTYNITLSYPLNIEENKAYTYKKDYNQILSTFRFTGNQITSSAGGDKSDWKTYKNTLNKYELQYPQNATITENGDPNKPDCLKITLNNKTYLSIQSPNGNVGCTQTGMGTYEKIQPVTDSFTIQGRAYMASGNKIYSSENALYGDAYSENLRVIDQPSKGYIIEISGEFNNSQEEMVFNQNKEELKSVLSTFIFTK